MSDLISRQAILKNIEKIRQGAQMMDDTHRASILMNGMYLCEKAVRNQPSAQPEIIRCKDCKHSEHWYSDKSRCFLWHEEGIDVFEDGFCNYAERREHE